MCKNAVWQTVKLWHCLSLSTNAAQYHMIKPPKQNHINTLCILGKILEFLHVQELKWWVFKISKTAWSVNSKIPPLKAVKTRCTSIRKKSWSISNGTQFYSIWWQKVSSCQQKQFLLHYGYSLRQEWQSLYDSNVWPMHIFNDLSDLDLSDSVQLSYITSVKGWHLYLQYPCFLNLIFNTSVNLLWPLTVTTLTITRVQLN